MAILNAWQRLDRVTSSPWGDGSAGDATISADPNTRTTVPIFSTKWFIKHQGGLVWFANTFIGRRVLRIHGERSGIGKNKVVGILPNAIFWKGKKEDEYVAEFRTHDKFGKRLYFAFKPLWHLFHLWDAVWYPNFNLGFDTLTTYPAAGANAPVDGWVTAVTSALSFTNLRAAAGTGAVANNDGSGAGFIHLLGAATTNTFNTLHRGIFCFNTEPIPDAATITGATLSLYRYFSESGLGKTSCEIVTATPASTSNLQASDFGQTGTTSFGSIDFDSYGAGYNDIALNASGIANIDVDTANNTKFGARLGWDRSGTFGGTWASGAYTRFMAYMADYTGDTRDPKLTVTYSIPSGAIFFGTNF